MIHPALIWDEGTVILADAGFPGMLPLFREAALREGVSWDRLDEVILTHQDFDHLGGLPGILKAAPRRPDVLAHAAEQPYIEGDKTPIKMTPERVTQMQKQLEEPLPEERRNYIRSMLAPTKVRVDRTLADGEVLPYCGGITVIHTPGHTPGHISLYHQRSKTLISGDALNLFNGELEGPNPQFTYDMETALHSLRKLGGYDIQQVLCYHGGLYRENPGPRIAKLAGNR